MSNIPRSLTDSALNLFKLAISASDPNANRCFSTEMPHIHFNHHGGARRSIPKGCLAVMVGQGAEQQRFVIPVMYVNHPLFTQLLKASEEEYGFDQKGPINIPCHVEEFRHVRGLIDKETAEHGSHHQDVHHHHQFLCFKA